MRDLIVKIAMKMGFYQFLVKLDTSFKEKKMRRAFLKYGLETLDRANKAFSSMNAKMFPVFGTLLGAYREKGFISHDFDLDVGVILKDSDNDVEKIMRDFGFKRKRQFYVKDSGRVTEEQYEYEGVQLDVFYLYEDEKVRDGDFYCYCARRHEFKEWKEANKTDGFPCVLWPMKKCEFYESDFLGIKINMPEECENWLAGIYGSDFMTPVKSWTAEHRKTRIIHHTERLYRR